MRYPRSWTRWEEDEDDAFECVPAEPSPEEQAAIAVQKRREHAAYMRDWRRRQR